MNVRLPIVLSIVAVAGVAAFVRTQRPVVQSAPPAFATEDASMPARRSAFEHPRSSAVPAAVVVYVAGAVAHGGIYRLPPGGRADDAVRAAGGATATKSSFPRKVPQTMWRLRSRERPPRTTSASAIVSVVANTVELPW